MPPSSDRLDRRSADGTPSGRPADRGMERRRVDITPANMFSTTSPIPSRCSSTQPSPTARAICRRGRSIAMASPSKAARPSAPRRLIAQLASLPPVPGALDQIVQHFGTDLVAEVTGRSRASSAKATASSSRTAPAPANLAETAAFMDDLKRILDLLGRRRNRAQLSRRPFGAKPAPACHYLLGTGLEGRRRHSGPRPHQPDQPGAAAAVPPDRHDVKAEKRFLSTDRAAARHARRDHARPTPDGGQGLFRPEDNLPLCRDALRQLYLLIVRGKIEGLLAPDASKAPTGLSLMDENGIRTSCRRSRPSSTACWR